MRYFFLAFFLLCSWFAQAQKEPRQVIALSNDRLPLLTFFRPAKGQSNGTAIIICPGGAYAFRSDDGEGVEPAKAFNAAGITAFLLDYRLPAGDDTIPLHDAQSAIKYIRIHAKDYHIDPDKIGILGFSAGGHLASTAGTHFRNATERPDFMVLVYPVISMAGSLTNKWTRDNLLGKDLSPEKTKLYSNEWQVTDSTPGAFIVHSMDDHGVKVANSLYFEAALLQHQVPAELFLYARGGHAFGVENKAATVQWTGACIDWIKQQKWKKTSQ
jgi:acetyl esterase/lipase